MADLQSRVGKRVFYPNQSWIKPGYDPPKRSLLNRPSPESKEHEGEPELYSLTAASSRGRTRSPIRSDNTTQSSSTSRSSVSPTKPYIPLLERIQMEPDPDGGATEVVDVGDGDKQAMSLLDRLESPTLSTPAPLQAPMVGLDIRDNSDGDSRTGTLPTALPSALIGQNTSSGSGHPVNSSRGQLNGQHNNTLLSRLSDTAGNFPTGGSPNGTGRFRTRSLSHATSPPLSDASRNDSASPSSRGDRGSAVDQPIRKDSTPSSITPEDFLNRFLPLTQRIAQGRVNEFEAGNSTSAAEINASIVTEENIQEFNKQLLNLRSDLEQCSDELKKDEMPHVSHEDDDHLVENTVLMATPGPPPSVPMPEMDLATISEGLPNHEIPIPIPIPEDITKMDSTSASYDKSPRRHSYSYHKRKSYSPEQRGGGDYRGRKDWNRYDDRFQHRSSNGKEPSRRSVSPLRRPHRSPRKDSYSHLGYSRSHHRSGSSGQRRGRSRSRSPHYRSREAGKGHHRVRSDRDYDYHRKYERRISDSVTNSSEQRPTDNGPPDKSHKKDDIASSTKEAEPPHPPCHNVPGLWFAHQGLHQLGISIVEFEIDDVSAVNWNLQNEETYDSSSGSNAAHMKLSLELCCLAFCDVQTTLQRLGKDVTSHELVQALSTLKKTWPPPGTLIIAINPGSKKGRSWLPNVLSQTEFSLHLEQYVHKGNNIVKFIQLSNLSEQIFVLLATVVDQKRSGNGFSKLKFLFPEEHAGICFKPPTLSVDRK